MAQKKRRQTARKSVRRAASKRTVKKKSVRRPARAKVQNNDNAIVAFLVLAIFVSSAGLLVMINSTSSLGPSGAATGVAKVNVTPAVAISLPVNEVDFGNKFPGDTDNTTDDSPGPLTIQNDGSVNVNVSIGRQVGAPVLFSGTGGGDNTTSFQYKFAIGGEAGSFDVANSVNTYTPVPGTAATTDALVNLSFGDSADLAEVDLKIIVPSDEPSGQKNTTLEFIAEQTS